MARATPESSEIPSPPGCAPLKGLCDAVAAYMGTAISFSPIRSAPLGAAIDLLADGTSEASLNHDKPAAAGLLEWPGLPAAQLHFTWSKKPLATFIDLSLLVSSVRSAEPRDEWACDFSATSKGVSFDLAWVTGSAAYVAVWGTTSRLSGYCPLAGVMPISRFPLLPSPKTHDLKACTAKILA